ncbi:hypothetical protein, conserved [Angomonas deanei]|uniref:Uncharacterized protein n=1 Tax=Angomonas deanei TaxID=59799 RepID=A0A7G2CH84_9TRYP|nr:hypothetical protein, conserved [Angomonas deanei]
MCMTVERLIGDDKEGSVQWETTKIPVLQILKKAREAKRATSVQLHDGHVFMGDDALFRFTGDTNVFQRIKTYIEAATYVCVLTEIFTVYDSLGNAHVLYPHLVRSLLLPRPPPQQPLKGEEAERKVIYIENLFRSVYTPMEKLDTYANTKGIFMYAGKAATESTLHNTQDSEEKRRRNVVPNTTDDLLRFDLGKTTHSTSVTFAIEKVRLPEEVEEGAHCFCYVSTITPQNVFLPAVKVPVTSIRNSTKEGYTWTFKTKDKKDETLLFGGPHDRLYVECCFELPGETSSPPTTWCAGYAVVELEGLKTSTLPVHQGSLLNLESDAPPAEEEKKGKKSFLSKLKKEKKPAGQTATSIKIKVVKTKGEPEYLSNMPKRYLVKSRHAQLISDLRGAIIELGKECAYAGQALRQQVVLRIFSVAANDELLDQLELFLRHHAKHYSKEESKSGEGRCRDLLLGVTSFAALFNCSDEVSSFAQTLIKKKPLEDAFSENTMMRCISI